MWFYWGSAGNGWRGMKHLGSTSTCAAKICRQVSFAPGKFAYGRIRDLFRPFWRSKLNIERLLDERKSGRKWGGSCSRTIHGHRIRKCYRNCTAESDITRKADSGASEIWIRMDNIQSIWSCVWHSYGWEPGWGMLSQAEFELWKMNWEGQQYSRN